MDTTNRKKEVETESAQIIRNLECFICKSEQIPSKISLFTINANQLDASNGPSRLILLNIFLKALDIKKLEVHKLFITNDKFPFCKNCLAKVIEIIKMRQKIDQFEKDLKSLVDGLKNIIYSTSDDADQIFKDSLKNDDNDEIENFPRAGQDDLRNIFRKAIIIDIKFKEFLSQKVSEYKKASLETRKKRSDTLRIQATSKLISSKLKAKLLKSSNQIIDYDSNQIDKNAFTEGYLLPNTLTDPFEDGEFSVENARDLELELSNDQNNQISTENSPLNEQIDSFDESYFSNANDNETSSSVNKVNKEGQNSFISYKDFKSDYEKECLKNKVDGRKRRARRDSEEIPEIPEVFGSVPTSLTGNREGKLFYESYEIKCILEDPDNPKVQCVTCSKLFDVNQIKKKVQHTNPFIAVIDHIRAYHIEEFNCKQCNLMFKCKYILYLHVKNSAAHQPAIATCEVCGMPSRKFSIKSMLRRHMWTHKSQQEKNELIKMGEKEPSILAHKNSKQKKKLPCPTCGKLVRSFLLRGHINAHLGKFYECEHCDKKYDNPGFLKKHVRNEHETPYQHFCQKCNKYFPTKQKLESHKHYKICTICDSTIRISANGKNKNSTAHVRCLNKKILFLRKQAKKTAKINKPILPPKQSQQTTCDVCGKVFSNMGRYKIHFATTHEPPQSLQFACTYCDKRYLFEHQLKWHLNIHTKEKEYSCPYCDMTKYSAHHIKMHKVNCLKKLLSDNWDNNEKYQDSSHHSSTQIKKIKLDETSLNSSSNIISDGFSPDDPLFINPHPPDNLDSSVTVAEMEEDVKPTVECKYCIFRFFSNKELLDHYVEVHKKQVFNCDACKLVFVSKGAYNKHAKTIFHEKNAQKSDQASRK